jgi:hypothetical protein
MFITPAELDASPKLQAYMDSDLSKRRQRIEQFLDESFFNPHARPESDSFAIDSFLQHPTMPRPLRLRLGSMFRLKF